MTTKNGEGQTSPKSQKKSSSKKKSSARNRPGGTRLYKQLLKAAFENALEPAGEAALPRIASVELIPSINQQGKINGANVSITFNTPGKDDEFPAVFMSMPVKELEDKSVTHLHMPPRRLRGDNVYMSDRPDARTAVALASIRVGQTGQTNSTYLLTQVPARGRAEGIFTDICGQLDGAALESLRRIGMVYKKKIGEEPVDFLAVDMGEVNQPIHIFGRIKEDGTLDFQVGDDWWSLSTSSATVDTTRNAQNFRGGPGSSSARARDLVAKLWEKALETPTKNKITLKQEIENFRGTPSEERQSRRVMGMQVPTARGEGTFTTTPGEKARGPLVF